MIGHHCKLILAFSGLLYIGGSFAATSPASPTDYLQLVFADAPPNCAAKSSPSKGVTAQCFKSVFRRGAATPLPPHIIQLTASGPPATQSSNAAKTVTYRALGPEQLAKDIPGASSTPLGSGPPRDYELIVFSDPAPGQEATYNAWYDEQHVPDVLRVPGFVSGRRYVLNDAGHANELQLPRYLVVFKLKSADVAATDAEIGARLKDGRTRMSPSFDGKGAIGMFVSPD